MVLFGKNLVLNFLVKPYQKCELSAWTFFDFLHDVRISCNLKYDEGVKKLIVGFLLPKYSKWKQNEVFQVLSQKVHIIFSEIYHEFTKHEDLNA